MPFCKRCVRCVSVCLTQFCFSSAATAAVANQFSSDSRCTLAHSLEYVAVVVAVSTSSAFFYLCCCCCCFHSGWSVLLSHRHFSTTSTSMTGHSSPYSPFSSSFFCFIFFLGLFSFCRFAIVVACISPASPGQPLRGRGEYSTARTEHRQTNPLPGYTTIIIINCCSIRALQGRF